MKSILEPEMAMVQASEDGTVIKEAQAPGQSPYNSITGEENPDFDLSCSQRNSIQSFSRPCGKAIHSTKTMNGIYRKC